MPSIRVKSERAFVTKQHSTSTFRPRFNWRLWVVLGALTDLVLLDVARWWAPSPAPPSAMRESRRFNQMRRNQLRFRANASTLSGRVFVTQQPVIIADCLHDIEAGQLLPQTFGYHDLLLVPLGSGGRPLGVLMLANKRNGEFSGNYDVKLAASLGAEVAVSLENPFLFDAARQQALRLDASMEMLRQVSQALTATTVGPTALLQGVARAVVSVSGAASCLITLTKSGNPAQQAVEVRDGVQPGIPEDKLT